MAKSDKQKIWIVLDHPMQFATALAIASHWGREDFVLNLLISPHPYWRKVDINLYRYQFDEVIYLERPDYTWHPIRALQMILRIWRLKRRIARLNIKLDDIIIGLSVFHYLENMVLSMQSRNRKIAIMPSVVYQESINKIDKSIYRGTLEGWLASWLVEPIAGLHRTYCMKERLHPERYWRIRYKESLPDIYHKVVVLGTISDGGYQLGNSIITMPYPYVLALGETKEENFDNARKSQKVVFFGNSFSEGYFGLKPEVYAHYVNQCLSFLREKYASTHKLVYRPHPTESDEIKLLNLDQFDIEDDGMLSELYFYKNFADIYAVFSVGSTSSRTALHFFINAYAFINTFPFDEATKNYFRLEMGSVPDDFYIRDFSRTPKRYIKMKDADAAIKRCQDVLDLVLQN
ncbi:hypothetical protein ACFLWG_04060 [Chloroflexota bacterium]